MDYCVPYSIQRDRVLMKQWDQKILQCFEEQNIKDLTIEEAQEQFLTLISSYKYTFGSYFTVKRKPVQGVFTMKNNQVKGVGVNAPTITNRR